MNTRRVTYPCFKQSGITYTEILIATLLIMVSLVPAIDALQVGLLGSQVQSDTSQAHHHLTRKMEQLLATPYQELLEQADIVANPNTVIPAPFSDTAGSDSRRLVYLARYDADNSDNDNDPFTDPDAGLLWIRVAIENTTLSMETLTLE